MVTSGAGRVPLENWPAMKQSSFGIFPAPIPSTQKPNLSMSFRVVWCHVSFETADLTMSFSMAAMSDGAVRTGRS